MNVIQAQTLFDSFKQLEKTGYSTGIAFYQELFKHNPQLKRYFKGDMNNQVEKFMSTLKLVVHSFEADDSGEYQLTNDLRVPLQHLGKKHEEYGVTSAMYKPVEEALLRSLQKALGESFTQDLKETWSEAYREVARQMQTK